MRNSMLSMAHLGLGLAMIAACGVAIGLTPTRLSAREAAIHLERIIPSEFNDWRELKTGLIQMDLTPRDGADPTMERPYDETLMRTYVRSDGAVVMVALAWGRNQRQDVKIHRPELCYVAQGFDVASKQPVTVELAKGASVPAYRLTAANDSRAEPITYWIRIGDDIAKNAWQSRMTIFKEGLIGRTPDGMLVRVSQALPRGAPLEQSYRTQGEFLRDLYAAVDTNGKHLLAGSLAN